MAANKAGVKAGKAFILIEALDKTGAILNKVSTKFKQFASKMSSMGQSMMTRSLGVLIPAGLMTKSFADFEHHMQLISTMLEEPDKHIDNFRDGIRSLSKEVGKDTGDLAKGLYDILSAQVPPDNAFDVLASSAKLALAGNAEVADSTSAMITLLETYEDELKGAGDAADFLMSMVARGRTTLPEMAASIGDVIAIAKESGLSLEDMGASFALLTRATGKTESALTALQAVSAGILKPSEQGAKLWKDKFGDSLNSATVEAIGMVGVLERLKTLSKGEIAEIFPNIRAMRGIYPAIAKMEGFSDDLGAMRDRAGESGKALDKMMQSPLVMLQQAWETVKDLGVALGEAFFEPLKTALPIFKDIIAVATKWVSENQRIVATGITIVAGVAAMSAGLLVASTAVGVIGSALATLGTVASALTGTLLFVFSPAGGLLVLGIGAAIALIYQFKDTIADIGATISTTFSDAFGAVLDGNYKAAWDIFCKGMELTWAKTVKSVVEVWDNSIELLAIAWIAFTNTMQDTWDDVKATVKIGMLEMAKAPLAEDSEKRKAYTLMQDQYSQEAFISKKKRKIGADATTATLLEDMQRQRGTRTGTSKVNTLQTEYDALVADLKKTEEEQSTQLEEFLEALGDGFSSMWETGKSMIAGMFEGDQAPSVASAISPRINKGLEFGTVEAAQQAQENQMRNSLLEKQATIAQKQLTAEEKSAGFLGELVNLFTGGAV